MEDAAEEGEGREEEDEWVHVDDTDAGVLFACACEFITPAAVCAGTFELTTSGIRPSATSVCGLEVLVCEALRY